MLLVCQRLSFLDDLVGDFLRHLVHYQLECCHVYRHASDVLEGCGRH